MTKMEMTVRLIAVMAVDPPGRVLYRLDVGDIYGDQIGKRRKGLGIPATSVRLFRPGVGR
jgi:hypothetical protein